MQEQMRLLAEMEGAALRVSGLESDITALPRRLQEADTAVAQATAALQQTRTRLKAEEAARRRMESDIVDQRTRATKYRAQTNTVTTTEQLKALEHEISFAEQQAADLETREFESMETTETLEAEARERQAAVDAAGKHRQETQQYVCAKSQELHGQLQAARASRDQLRAKVEPEWLAKYDSVAKTRKTGVAEVIDGECQACHMRMRPHHWNQLRGGEMQKCEGCGRMLYYDEGNDRQLAKKAAGRLDVP